MPQRKLVLKKENMVDLTNDELRAVNAGLWTPGCPLFIRLRELLSEIDC